MSTLSLALFSLSSKYPPQRSAVKVIQVWRSCGNNCITGSQFKCPADTSAKTGLFWTILPIPSHSNHPSPSFSLSPDIHPWSSLLVPLLLLHPLNKPWTRSLGCQGAGLMSALGSRPPPGPLGLGPHRSRSCSTVASPSGTLPLRWKASCKSRSRRRTTPWRRLWLSTNGAQKPILLSQSVLFTSRLLLKAENRKDMRSSSSSHSGGRRPAGSPPVGAWASRSGDHIGTPAPPRNRTQAWPGSPSAPGPSRLPSFLHALLLSHHVTTAACAIKVPQVFRAQAWRGIHLAGREGGGRSRPREAERRRRTFSPWPLCDGKAFARAPQP